MPDPDLERLLTEFQPQDMRQGLFVPSDQLTIAGSTVPALVSSQAVRASGLIAVGIRAQTQPIDYFATYITATDYLPPIPRELLDSLIETIVNKAPFKTVATMLAILNCFADDGDTEGELLPIYVRLLKPEYATRLLAAIDSDMPQRRLLARQVVLRTLRYAIERSSDIVEDDVFELYTCLVLTHYCADTLGHSQDELAADDDPEFEFDDLPVGLTLDVVRNEVFNRAEDPLVLLSRAKMLWEITPNPTEYPLRAAPEDLLADATGLTSAEWLSFGFGAWAHRNSNPPGGPMWMPQTYFSGADPHKRQAFFDGVAADRECLVAGFEGQDHDWGFVPFEQYPLLRDGTDYLVIDVPCLIDRVTTGLYWYVLDFERTVGNQHREAWQRAFGSIFEQYALGIAERMALPLLTGGSTFYGPENLKRAAAGKSPDCAIDFGSDLVLLEIVGGRLTLGSRVDGDARALANDTYKLVYKKAEQLDSFINEMLDDETPLIGSSAPDGRRYFPVIVNLGSYPINPMTMTAVESHLDEEGWFADGRVEPLVIIDIGELEIVEALKEHSVGTLPEHLDSWIASDLHRVSLRNHLYDKIDESQGNVFRSAALLEAWEELQRHFLSVLAPGAVGSTEGRASTRSQP